MSNKAIFFIESYHSGGHEKVALLLLDILNFNQIHFFINKRYKTRMIDAESLNDKIKLHYYSLLSPNEISMFINSLNNKILKNIMIPISALLKYPLILFSIFYFYFKFRDKCEYKIFLSINGGYPGGEYNRSSLIAGKILNKNLFMTFFNKPPKSKKIFSILENIYDNFLDNNVQFICDSNENARLLNVNRNFINKPQIIHNGLEPIRQEKLKIKKTLLHILNVSNFEDRKNQDLLIDVVNKLVFDKYFNIKLTLIGAEIEKDYKIKIINKIKKLNLLEYIDVLDYKDSLDSYYEESDLFVLSSKAESLPLVIILAMNHGLPIISTNVGGVGELIINRYNGLLVESENCDEMVASIKYFIDNSKELHTYGTNSKNIFLNNFSLNHMSIKYNKILGII